MCDSPLRVVCARLSVGRYRCAQVLLANNADASLGDNDGRTPLASMKEPDWHKRKADRERRQVCVAGASFARALANPTRRRSVWASGSGARCPRSS